MNFEPTVLQDIFDEVSCHPELGMICESDFDSIVENITMEFSELIDSAKESSFPHYWILVASIIGTAWPIVLLTYNDWNPCSETWDCVG